MAQGFRCLRAAIRATRPHLANIFKKLLDQKTFVCLRLVIGNIFLRETSRIRFGKAGAHPQLALGIAIAPETLSFITTFQFKRQLRFFRFFLRFYLQIPVQFHLLRKCGLLAHTSPTFLKNCWIKKLFILPAARFLQPIQTIKKKTANPVFQNQLSSVADVCASPEAQGMDISDDIPNGGVFSRYIAQNLYGRKNFRYNLISFSKTAAYSFAPINACISISTSCVGRFSSLMPIQVQHGRLSLKNSE